MHHIQTDGSKLKIHPKFMKNIILLNLLILILNLQAQEERKLKIKKSKGFYSEYFVKKDNKKVKDGSYIKYRHALIGIAHYGIALSETGYYKNNAKDSIWQYFYNEYPLNSVKGIGQYANGLKEGDWMSFYLGSEEIDYSLTYNKKNIWKIDSLSMFLNYSLEKIRSSGIFFRDNKVGLWRYYYNGNIYLEFNHTSNKPIYDPNNLYPQNEIVGFVKPHFIGGNELIIEYLNEVLYPEPYKHKLGVVIIEFTVDTYGSVKDFIIVENRSNKIFGKDALHAIKNLPHEWIPSFSNRIAKDTTYQIKVSLETCNEQGPHTITYWSKNYQIKYEFIE